MTLASLSLFVIILILFQMMFCRTSSSTVAGPFDIAIHEASTCKAGTAKLCGKHEVQFTILNRTSLQIKLILKEDMKRPKLTIDGKSKGKQILRVRVDNICQNPVLEMMYRAIVKMGPNCILLKGTNVGVLNLDDLAKLYFGGQFIYGNFSFKSVLYNDHCNYICVVVVIGYSPNKT